MSLCVNFFSFKNKKQETVNSNQGCSARNEKRKKKSLHS